MKEYTKWMETNPKILKLILCLGPLDWSWAFYRIFKGITRDNALEIILGVLWIFVGSTFLWILDIIWICLYNRPFWFK